MCSFLERSEDSQETRNSVNSGEKEEIPLLRKWGIVDVVANFARTPAHGAPQAFPAIAGVTLPTANTKCHSWATYLDSTKQKNSISRKHFVIWIEFNRQVPLAKKLAAEIETHRSYPGCSHSLQFNPNSINAWLKLRTNFMKSWSHRTNSLTATPREATEDTNFGTPKPVFAWSRTSHDRSKAASFKTSATIAALLRASPAHLSIVLARRWWNESSGLRLPYLSSQSAWAFNPLPWAIHEFRLRPS